MTPQKLTWWVIWGALLMAVAIYFLVLQQGVVTEDPDGPWKNIRAPLIVASSLLLVASFSIRFLVTRQVVARSGEPTQSSFASYMVSLALAETTAIFGLVIGFQGAPKEEYSAFFLIGFVALLFQPPTFLHSRPEAAVNVRED